MQSFTGLNDFKKPIYCGHVVHVDVMSYSYVIISVGPPGLRHSPANIAYTFWMHDVDLSLTRG